jgi:hypothetical protein
MNSERIAKEMELALLRSRTGLISADQAAKEVTILQAMLRAREQAELEQKLDALRATLEARGGPARHGRGHA